MNDYTIFPIGDSKTIALADGGLGYPPRLRTLLLSPTHHSWFENPPRAGYNGGSSLTLWTSIQNGDLNALTGSPRYITMNFGVNDIDNDNLSEADFKLYYGNSLDWLHTKFPSSQIYIARPWWRTSPASQVKMNAMDNNWIPFLISTRSYCHLGPDERIFLENGDDGVSLTTDGTHPNAAGYDATAQAWKTSLGY